MNREKLLALLEQAPDALIFADSQGVIRFWNDKACETFGFTSGEAINHTLDMIIPPDLRAQHWHGFHQAINSGQTRSRDKRLVTPALRKDGRPLYVDLRFSVVHDTAGAVLGATAIVRDMTKRFLAEDAALDFELRLRTKKAEWQWAG